MKNMYLKNVYFYIYILCTALVLSLFNPFFFSKLNEDIDKLTYYENVEYDFTVKVDNRKQDCYVIIKEYCGTQINDDNSLSGFINATTLMQIDIEYSNLGFYQPANILKGEYKTLNNNECAITNDIAEKLNLDVGDKIFSLQDETYYEYEIVNILVNTFDFSNPTSGENASYIFCGYDETRIKKPRYLSFAIYDEEVDKNANDHFFVSNLIETTKSLILKKFIITCVIIFLLIFIYFCLNKKDIINMIRLYHLSYKKQQLVLYLSIECIITFVLIMLAGIIPALIFNQLSYLVVEVGIIVLIIYLKNLISLLRKI